MAQTAPQWTEIEDFANMAEKLIAKYPERFGKIEPKWMIGYAITNKEKPEGKAKPYEMSGLTEPESFASEKKYFFKTYMNDWESRSEESKLLLVLSALERVDKENPESGKVGPLDYRDQSIMVRTFGADWIHKGRVPHLLNDDVEFYEEPSGEI